MNPQSSFRGLDDPADTSSAVFLTCLGLCTGIGTGSILVGDIVYYPTGRMVRMINERR